jgi:hypothetical protein
MHAISSDIILLSKLPPLKTSLDADCDPTYEQLGSVRQSFHLYSKLDVAGESMNRKAVTSVRPSTYLEIEPLYSTIDDVAEAHPTDFRRVLAIDFNANEGILKRR